MSSKLLTRIALIALGLVLARQVFLLVEQVQLTGVSDLNSMAEISEAIGLAFLLGVVGIILWPKTLAALFCGIAGLALGWDFFSFGAQIQDLQDLGLVLTSLCFAVASTSLIASMVVEYRAKSDEKVGDWNVFK